MPNPLEAAAAAEKPTALLRGYVLDARAVAVVEHVAGQPVSAHTYGAHGCRCPGCTAANTRQARRYWAKRRPRTARSLPAPLLAVRNRERKARESAARGRAATAIIAAHRDEYAELVERFRAELAAERGPLPGADWLGES